jgi:hypothetical protein
MAKMSIMDKITKNPEHRNDNPAIIMTRGIPSLLFNRFLLFFG